MGQGCDQCNTNLLNVDLHSRQLVVYGHETMRRFFASNVLISGMQGLGAEIAKNIILAGVKSVTLHDEGLVELWDLSGNFLFSETDIGRNRALASVHKLQELNNAVRVSILTTKLTKHQLSNYQVVVFTNIDLKTAIEFDDYCHKHQPPVAFIKTEVRGLFGNVFCDFGPEFTVDDVDGEEPHSGIVTSVSNDSPALVTCFDERLEFQDGDLVIFSEIHGMPELNDGRPRKVKSCGPRSFLLEEDTTNFGSYVRGGIVTQVKHSKVLNFKPLKEALRSPGEFLLSDISKFDRPPLLHLAFQALDKFIMREYGRFPVAGSEDDAREFISIATAMNESLGDGKLDDINPKLLQDFAYGARAVLNPMAAMFGGIVAQEVLKACSGKIHPLLQFFYFDSVESLPTEPLDPSDYRPLNTRYDAQISVFGAKFQKKLENTRCFVVGSDALGCEFLKNLALMGVSCGSTQGKLTVADDGVIERSNFTRQLLFRDWNFGQAKSTVAASAAALINPRLQIEALQNRVGSESVVFDDNTFWEHLDVVINALDNVEARHYVDQRCVTLQKPLLESDTLGAKCNTQMVIPHLSESYGASMHRGPAKQAPMSNVHWFPYNFDHCFTWACSEFEELLVNTPSQVNAYLSNPSEYISSHAKDRDILARVLECLGQERSETFQDCIMWARQKFEDYFSDRMNQLILSLPEDAVTSTGALFWSGPKRFPRPLEFSVSDRTHLNFVVLASVLRAEILGMQIPNWAYDLQKIAETVDRFFVPQFYTEDEDANKLIKKLEQSAKTLPSGYAMKPINYDFYKKDYYIGFIAVLANMRARNYNIPEVDKLTARVIAGTIIPAIATSTAMATGLVCLELYKVIDGGHNMEDYRNTSANLALPLFSMVKPVSPKAITHHQGMSWTVWDQWAIKGNPTIRQVIEWLSNRGLVATSFLCRCYCLYDNDSPRHNDLMDTKVVDLARKVGRNCIPPPYRRHLDLFVTCEDEEGKDIEIPMVSVYFR